MNPIFSRCYKGSSRPNIMPTAAKRQNYMKSVNTTGNGGSSSSGSSLSSGSGSVLSTLSMGDSTDDPGDLKSPEKEDYPQLFTKSKGKHGGGRETDSRLLAQQLFASKQNMLAQLSLTPHENRQRAKLRDGGGGGKGGSSTQEEKKLGTGPSMKQSFSSENFRESLRRSSGGGLNNMPRSPTVHDIGGGGMALCDLDQEEEELVHQHDHHHRSQTDYYTASPSNMSSVSSSYAPVANSRISRPNLNQCITKEPLDMKIWRELRQVVCGTTSFHDGWIGQGFIFDTKIPFGLIQKKGGPCGVLAVVQSLVIRNLLFGSPFSPHNNMTKESEQRKKLEDITAFLTSGGDVVGMMMEDDLEGAQFLETFRKDRVECLVDAVAEIIWTCGEYQNRHRAKQDNRSSLIMFSDFRIQPEVICVKGRMELQHFLQNSIHRFDCIALVYSAVLTRGISGVKDDMDFENCSLIGQHGYCSQELINLLAFGRAISNTFDHEIELDGKVLKGIPERCDIGLLSLFEHYDSIKVGSFLKCPRYPVWMICSESHFSLIFSCTIGLCTGELEDAAENSSFDLFYYDGLARQDGVVRLSIRLPGKGQSCYSSYNTPSEQSFGDNHFSKFLQTGTSAAQSKSKDEDLIPPLEKCIRTKWQGALVDWNDTEPIL